MGWAPLLCCKLITLVGVSFPCSYCTKTNRNKPHIYFLHFHDKDKEMCVICNISIYSIPICCWIWKRSRQHLATSATFDFLFCNMWDFIVVICGGFAIVFFFILFIFHCSCIIR